MHFLVRPTALCLAVLLVIQGLATMPGCEDRAGQPAPAMQHEGMPGMPGIPMDHSEHPAPAHHATCDLALCAMMTSCGPTALVTHAPRLAPSTTTEQGSSTWVATSNPVGPTAPEPPPPRA